MNEHPSQPDSSPELPTKTDTKTSRTPWVLLLPFALLGGALWMRGNSPQQNPADNQLPAIATPAPIAATEATLYVPTDDGFLGKQRVKLSEGLKGKEAAIAAVEQMMQASPGAFPKDAKVLGLVTQGDVAQINFNRAFDNDQFWQGSTRTTLGVDSVVNTLTQNDFGIGRVLFLIEGKPMELLGELDVSEPLKPNLDSVKE